MECKCSICVSYCKSQPGWFLPGEAEKAAEFMDLTLQEFFDRYLGVNWWVGDHTDGEADAFVLAPAITVMQPGEEYPAMPKGVCIFLKEGLCQIHGAKPYECAETMHDDGNELSTSRRKKMVVAWKENQAQISELLKRDPRANEMSLLDWFELTLYDLGEYAEHGGLEDEAENS